MHQFLTVARPHHERWVRVGTIVVLAAYLAAAAAHLLTSPSPFPQVYTELGAIALCTIAVLAAWRGRVSTAVVLVVGGLWAEVHATALITADLGSTTLVVLPGFVAAAGLLAGGPAALVMASFTSLTIPASVLLGSWLRTGRATLGSAEVSTVVILAVALVGVAMVMHLGLSAFGKVLERAQANERLFSDLVNNSPDGIVALGADGRMESANPAARTILGVGEAAIGGLPFAEVLSRLAAEGDVDVGPLLRGEAEGATLLLKPPGRDEVSVELAARRTARPDGAPGTQVTLRDVTFRVRAEEDRRRFEQRLQRAQRLEAVGQLAGGVAHDFNNLLQAMFGNIELLKLEVGEGHPARASAAEIEKAVRRGGELIRKLLTFARKGAVEPEVVDINAIVRDLDPMLRRLIPADIELINTPAPDVWPVRVDPGQFEQVVVNLALNGRDAMPNGGRLVIATANATLGPDDAAAADLPPGEYVRLTVTDTGTGMSPEVVARIFEPFFTTKAPGKGTGLGLATCFGIVAQADGHITARTGEGEGSTFEVLLPRRAAGEITGKRSTPTGSRPAAGGSETVLVVEDDEQVRSATARGLSARGYRVLTAASGEEAIRLSRATESTIDLLLSDVVMPGMGGKELASRLVAERPGMGVLFSSGYAEDAIVHRGVLEPGLEFLPKPYTQNELALRVRAVLDSRANAAGG